MNNTPLYQEIMKIAHDARNPNYPYKYTAFIHVLTGTQYTHRTLKVLNIDIERDYDNNIADEISCTVSTLPGTWSDLIMPSVENLEITIIKQMVGTYSGDNEVRRYRAYCKTPIDIRKSNPQFHNLSMAELDRMAAIEVEFQLVPVLVDKLLPVEIGTIAVESTMEETLSALLMSQSSVLQGLDDDDMLKGVDMVKADNQTKYMHVPIPHGVKLVNLPTYLQKQSYGVYQQGLNHYIQNGIWYVYPRFRDKRNDDKVRYLNIFVSPRDIFRYAPKTFRKEGEDLYIIGKLEAEAERNIAATLLNQGNGIRAVNLDNLESSDVSTVKDNKAYYHRGKAMHEVLTAKSPTGNDYAPLDLDKQNINIYERIAENEGRVGKTYAIIWQNSVPDLIKPGTIVRLFYLSATNEQKMVEGILMKAHHYIHATNKNMVGEEYAHISGLFIYTKSTE